MPTNKQNKLQRRPFKKGVLKALSYLFNYIKNIGNKTRFSISYRIALSNLRLLVQYALVVTIVVTVGISIIFLKNIPMADYHEFIKNTDIDNKQAFDAYCKKENISMFIFSPKDLLTYKYSTVNLDRNYSYIPKIVKSGELSFLSLPYKLNSLDETYYMNIYTDITYPLNTAVNILKIVYISLALMVLLTFYKSTKITKILLSPLREMSSTINKISNSNLTSRINVSNSKYELKEIAQSFNHMMDNFEVAYQKQKQFVSDASHELRTPISVIQGYANMLNRWGKNDEKITQESIDAIIDETNSMKDLVEKLLFIARSDKSTIKPDKTEFKLFPLVKDLIKEFKLIAPNKEFSYSVLFKPTIYADKNRTKEAYRIIIDNAVKYTSQNGRITLKLYAEDDYACLSIGDNGPGIPNEELPKIFDRFYKNSRGSKKTEAKSHGLGLALAKIIVLAHFGKITVRSSLGKGTEFIVKLPLY